ncbi:MAG: carbohydrate-binding domain-containing protein [Clostridiales bacterium]|nr:carbohydrate-binding domain-containing protein [Clostridiales bacterium]
MKRMISMGLILILISFLNGGMAADLDVSTLYKDRDVEDGWKMEEVETIRLSENGAEVSDTDMVTVDGSTVTILEEGDYLLTGNWKGQIVVSVSEEEKVRLILQNVTIDSPEGPAILEKSADKLVLTLDAGSTNKLTDHTEMNLGEEIAAAAVYAQDDLSINGEGTLIVEGHAKNGIHSKADLVIASGNLEVHAENDAVKGRNSVLVLGGNITITGNGDGLVSNRDNKDDKGWVVIAGGTISVRTGDGAENGKQKNASSRKGLKAETSLTILDGHFVLDTEDDGIHARDITIQNGTFEISSGDDAIQAEEKLILAGGDIWIRLCDEEIRGEKVEAKDGVIRTDAE